MAGADNLSLSERMSRVHSKDTKPELAVRKELWRRGFRYRINVRKLPGTPDIVLSKYRTVIFVNGCFWHGHKGCRRYSTPKTNMDFWKEKVANNRERDLLNNQRLESIAWSIITIWECELAKSRFHETMDRVEAEIRTNKAKWEDYNTLRRHNRWFALEQAKKRREIAAIVEAELRGQFSIPVKIQRVSKNEDEY